MDYYIVARSSIAMCDCSSKTLEVQHPMAMLWYTIRRFYGYDDGSATDGERVSTPPSVDLL